MLPNGPMRPMKVQVDDVVVVPEVAPYAPCIGKEVARGFRCFAPNIRNFSDTTQIER